MKFDEYGLIVMEHVQFPGNVGDSCAETFRFYLLRYFLGLEEDLSPINIALAATSSGRGYLRHPQSPWREDDFSCDQWLPRYLASSIAHKKDKAETFAIKAANYRTGNGDLISPLAFAAIKRIEAEEGQWLDMTLWLQTMLFQIPFRWNDERTRFERSSNSSSDYLNWFMYLIYCELTGSSFWSRKAKRAMDPTMLISKIRHYYRSEPDPIILPLYEAAVKQLYSISTEEES
jgi:hypothetical protein